MIKSSSVKLNQRTAEYLYMLKTKPKLKLFQNEIANNEKALTRTRFKRRCLKLAHTGPPRGRQDRAERTTRQRAKVSVLCLSGPPARTQRPERPSANQVSKYFKVLMTPIPVNNHIEIYAWHRLLMHLGLETLLLLESRPLRKSTRPVTL